MAKFKIGDYVTRKEEYTMSWAWLAEPKNQKGQYLVKGFDSDGDIMLSGLAGAWDPNRFNLVNPYASKELEELHTMGYRNG